ncbi:hypothetical protein OD350_03550 [Clostridium beijerinckii]|uniref:hypothetical protein n=1 Tax=Clostridium beijerinckii TaxID=1520 RepID=UPI0022278246|nr:hypothetical protein [Clostridium beijerinckii]UYZ36758.1 hypothetical protein OD350_03550 [Clostridium beijerinckii]
MTAYEELLHEAYNLGLVVKEVSLITRKGRCVGNRIAIDKNIKTDAEKACILREEIAHYKTTVGDITDQTKITNIKQERLARNIVIQNSCSLRKIADAVRKGARNKYEIIEILNITLDLFDESVEYYTHKQPDYIDDDIVLHFDNRLQIFRKY